MYEKTTVTDIINRNRGQIECPVTGCNHYVIVADLIPDKQMARKIERERKRAAQSSQQAKQDYMVLE